MRGIRRSRTGRVLLALRENERGAQSFGINVLRAKLTAFAISGFLAAFAGCLLVHLLQAFSPDTYGPGPELRGLHRRRWSAASARCWAPALGALYLQGAQWFLPGARWQILASAARRAAGADDHPRRPRRPGLPRPRRWLRWVARRQGIVVPSLLADVAQPGDDPDPDVIEHAEQKVEEVVDAGLPDRAIRGASGAGPVRAEAIDEVVDLAVAGVVEEKRSSGADGEVVS